jgi:hypothetical protein
MAENQKERCLELCELAPRNKTQKGCLRRLQKLTNCWPPRYA